LGVVQVPFVGRQRTRRDGHCRASHQQQVAAPPTTTPPPL
jgi:hypothetical protein